MSPLDGELLRTIGGISLIVARSWAILQAQVLWRGVVGRLWWAVAAGLALILAPISGPAPAIATFPTWAVAVAAELALGTAVGTLASLPGYALLGAGAASARGAQRRPAAVGGSVRIGRDGRGGRSRVASPLVGGADFVHRRIPDRGDPSCGWPPSNPWVCRSCSGRSKVSSFWPWRLRRRCCSSWW